MMKTQQRTYGSENNAAANKGGGSAPFSIPACKAGVSGTGKGSKTTGYGK